MCIYIYIYIGRDKSGIRQAYDRNQEILRLSDNIYVGRLTFSLGMRYSRLFRSLVRRFVLNFLVIHINPICNLRKHIIVHLMQ